MRFAVPSKESAILAAEFAALIVLAIAPLRVPTRVTEASREAIRPSGCLRPAELRRLEARRTNDDAWRIHYYYAFCRFDDARAIQWLHYLAEHGDASAAQSLSFWLPTIDPRNAGNEADISNRR